MHRVYPREFANVCTLFARIARVVTTNSPLLPRELKTSTAFFRRKAKIICVSVFEDASSAKVSFKSCRETSLRIPRSFEFQFVERRKDRIDTTSRALDPLKFTSPVLKYPKIAFLHFYFSFFFFFFLFLFEHFTYPYRSKKKEKKIREKNPEACNHREKEKERERERERERSLK